MIILLIYSKFIHRFYSQAFEDTYIKSINIPNGVTLGVNAFGNTPCPDTSIFQPGNVVEDCQVVSEASYVSRRNFDRVLYSTLSFLQLASHRCPPLHQPLHRRLLRRRWVG